MTNGNSPDQMPAQARVLSPGEGERFNIIGGGVRVLIDGASSGGRCFMFEGPIPPGDGPPLHWHAREDEMFYILEGRFKFSVDGREIICEQGAFVCAPRGVVHAFRNIGATTGRLLITCTPAGLEVPFRAISDPEPGSGRPALTPAQVMEELGKFGITFVGPPLGE